MAKMSQEQINTDLFDEVIRLKEDLKEANGKLNLIEKEWRYGTDDGLDMLLEDTFK